MLRYLLPLILSPTVGCPGNPNFFLVKRCPADFFTVGIIFRASASTLLGRKTPSNQVSSEYYFMLFPAQTVLYNHNTLVRSQNEGVVASRYDGITNSAAATLVHPVAMLTNSLTIRYAPGGSSP